MESARNPLAAPEYSLKKNFATSATRNFDHVNCSDDKTRVCSTKTSFRPRLGQNRRKEEGVKWVLCQGFETKHGTL
jgi:hypothetical protein